MRFSSHALVIPWQAAFIVATFTCATLSGLGPRIWLFGGAVILGATAHVKWRQRRSLPALTLPDIRRTTALSAAVFAMFAGILSAYTSTTDPTERVVVAVGAALIAGFATGVLTLCGLSLGAGSKQPVTAILPDPAHPGRPRRPSQRPNR
ncbi:MAG: hypothetical protein ACJAZO_004298 [Myxococcota bacterium]|jgi:hypothetical protein